MEILYQAYDGTIFTDEEECESYEASYNHPYLSEITFYDLDGADYYITRTDIFSGDVYQKSEKITIPDENAFLDFKWLSDECGWIEYNDILEPGTWTRQSDGYKATWIKEGG